MGFTSDLALGIQYQEKLLDLIEYDSYHMPEGCFKPYDVKVQYNMEETTIEVKVDRKARKTGNIVIEYMCNEKPSGISTTTADFWVYFIINTNRYYVIPTEFIHEQIRRKTYTRIVAGGDGNRSSMYLFPVRVFYEFVDYY